MLANELLSQVRKIQVVTGRQVADVLAGEYVSVFKGRGMEFDEVRPYVPGDDVRGIDWNVTARTGVPHIKRYVEERELTVMLLVDISASQDFGSGTRSKRSAATELSALIAFSAIKNNDKVGLLLFHGETEAYIPPRKGQKHALRVVREVLAHGRLRSAKSTATRPAGPRRGRLWRAFRRIRTLIAREPRAATDIGGAIEHTRRVLRRKAVIFVVSDFLDEGYMTALRSAHRRHDIIAVHIDDARERASVDAGLLTLEDPETGATMVVDTGDPAFRAAHEARYLAHSQELAATMRSSGVDLVSIDAAGSVIDPLVRFLRMRQRRARR
jgi:uncharacterized protein (DUF58 family)